MRRNLIVAAMVCLASGTVASTQSNSAGVLYGGTWKLNLAKSDFGETTVTYEQTASGRMLFTAAGQSYTFQVDGKDYPSLFAGTSAWKQIDSSTWEITVKQNGKLLSIATAKLSADGKILSMHEKGPKLTGERSSERQSIRASPAVQD